MINKRFFYSLPGALLLSGLVVCYGGNRGHEGIVFKDSVITVITCRQSDSLSENSLAFENAIDDSGPLKIYEFKYCRDTIICARMKALSNVKSLTGACNDVILYVHGHYKSFEDAAISGLKIQNLYHIKVIVYSWPSMMSKGPGAKNYLSSERNVELGASKFRELLLMVQKFKGMNDQYADPCHLSLCLHSLGNYYLERIVKDSLLYGIDNKMFDNIIMCAPAVSRDGHAAWLDKLTIQNRIYITSNRHDFNLAGVKVFTDSGIQLGKDPGSPLSLKGNYINFTKAVGFLFPTGATHNYFTGKMALKSEKIREFFDTVFHGKAINLSDSTMFSFRHDRLGYDFIP